jgi:hypothetical protein
LKQSFQIITAFKSKISIAYAMLGFILIIFTESIKIIDQFISVEYQRFAVAYLMHIRFYIGCISTRAGPRRKNIAAFQSSGADAPDVYVPDARRGRIICESKSPSATTYYKYRESAFNTHLRD